ncbi:hypothetical protein LPLWJ_12030 [Lactiplantibacillus plantarum WJL]|nr:hypothetical protein LPLWJ_12030 [Lactiplantibacillus plantarum WJL]KZU22089.1 hypothetical protein Nizo2485_2992 [Lactiplantibacillus plantarum]
MNVIVTFIGCSINTVKKALVKYCLIIKISKWLLLSVGNSHFFDPKICIQLDNVG